MWLKVSCPYLPEHGVSPRGIDQVPPRGSRGDVGGAGAPEPGRWCGSGGGGAGTETPPVQRGPL